MKYKRYVLHFDGDSEIVTFLERHVQKSFEGRGALAAARKKGKAARELFGVEYDAISVTLPEPTAERVRSL